MEPHPGLHDAPGSVTLSLIISLKQSLAGRVKSSEKRIDPPSAWPGPSGRKPSAMFILQAGPYHQPHDTAGGPPRVAASRTSSPSGVRGKDEPAIIPMQPEPGSLRPGMRLDQLAHRPGSAGGLRQHLAARCVARGVKLGINLADRPNDELGGQRRSSPRRFRTTPAMPRALAVAPASTDEISASSCRLSGSSPIR